MSKALNVIDKFEDLVEQGFSGSGSCRCPRCGATQPHLPGNPCRMKSCPKCKIPMTRTVKAGEGLEESELSPDVRSYLETVLWSSNDESDEAGGEPLDKNYDVTDFSAEAVTKAKADVNSFFMKAGDLVTDFDSTSVAHNFWLTRNGHGAGFWDTPENWGGEENAKKLTDLAKKFGELNVYISDDGELEFS